MGWLANIFWMGWNHRPWNKAHMATGISQAQRCHLYERVYTNLITARWIQHSKNEPLVIPGHDAIFFGDYPFALICPNIRSLPASSKNRNHQFEYAWVWGVRSCAAKKNIRDKRNSEQRTIDYYHLPCAMNHQLRVSYYFLWNMARGKPVLPSQLIS